MADADFWTALQGQSHVILRTPLGNWIVDPLGPADPTMTKLRQALGIEIELKAGPLSQADLEAPSLFSTLGLLAVAGGLLYLTKGR